MENTLACAAVGGPDGFAADVIDGLSRPRKSLSCRYLYDAAGSSLFDEITRLPDYYPTRAETEILEAHAAEIVDDGAGDETMLVEFGSGSCRKTEILLEQSGRLCAYAPIDICAEALEEARARLMRRFPHLDVRPIVADFSAPIALPDEIAGQRVIGFFPGSTIGNFTPAEAARLLGALRLALGAGSRLVIGVDLKKDPARLLAAYNDPHGVTAAFNLNLLARINRELGGGFDLDGFCHQAIYDAAEGRIEMRLVSRRPQEASVAGRAFGFRRGEAIHTESSYKYAVDDFRETARDAGWSPRRVWVDEAGLFSVHELASS